MVLFILPNVQSEPRSWLARSVLLGAQSVTAMIVGSTAWLGSGFISEIAALSFEPHLVALELTFFDRRLLDERRLPAFKTLLRNRCVTHTERLAGLSIYPCHVERALIDLLWRLRKLIAVEPHMNAIVIKLQYFEGGVTAFLAGRAIDAAFDQLRARAAGEKCEKTHDDDEELFHFAQRDKDQRHGELGARPATSHGRKTMKPKKDIAD